MWRVYRWEEILIESYRACLIVSKHPSERSDGITEFAFHHFRPMAQ